MEKKPHDPATGHPKPLEPQSHPNALGLPEQKGTGKKVWLVIITALIVAVFCIGGTWYYMTKKANNQKAELQTQIDELNNEIQSLKGKSASSTTSANLKDYTTKYEKISFSYPNTLVLTDTSTEGGANGEAGSDKIALTNGLFKATINTGAYGVGGACSPACKVLLSEPMTILGKQRYLNYVSTDGGPKADYVTVVDKPTDFYGYLEGKNVLVDGKPTLMFFMANYLNGDKQVAKTVAELQADPNIAAFKQTLTSMEY